MSEEEKQKESNESNSIEDVLEQSKDFIVIQSLIQKFFMLLIFIFIIHISRHQIGNFELFEISILCAAFIWLIVVEQNHNSMHLEYLIKRSAVEEQEKSIHNMENILKKILLCIRKRDEAFKSNLSEKELRKKLPKIVKNVYEQKNLLSLEIGMVKILCHEKIYEASEKYMKVFNSASIYFKFTDQKFEENISYELWSQANEKLIGFMNKELQIRKDKINLMEKKLKNIFGYVINSKWE